MILVDTAVWIDHLHKSEPALVNLLDGDRVGSQSLVLQELTLGSLRQRDVVLSLLSNLFRFPDVGHAEFLHLVEERRLWGRGTQRRRRSTDGSRAADARGPAVDPRQAIDVRVPRRWRPGLPRVASGPTKGYSCSNM